MSRCAIGFSIHTGWAVCVAAGGSLRAPLIEARERLQMLGQADRFLFHMAAEMDRSLARQSIERSRKEATKNATKALDALVARLRAGGQEVVSCAIVAKSDAMLPLDEILAAHPRIHTAEGRFYRDVLLAAAAASGLKTRLIPPKELDMEAAAEQLAFARRAAGSPWGKDQKMAALAAWAVL